MEGSENTRCSGKWVKAAVVAAVILIAVISGMAGLRKAAMKKRSDTVSNMIVSESRKIAELTSKEYFEDMILFDTEFNGIRTDTVAVLVARGMVRAGFDLSGIMEKDISISSDTVSIALPEPSILDVIINPSDIKVFYSAKGWDSARRTPRLVDRGKSELRNRAIRSGILDKANDSAGRLFEDLLRSSGYNTIEITTKTAPQQDLRIPDQR